MSLLDLAGQMLGGQQTGGNASLASAVLAMINNHPGGLPGLVSAFQQQGLGGVVNSWVGTGANQAVSPEQVQNVLGSGQLQDLAAKLGISPQDAGAAVSQLLPGVVDHLTPNGQMPDSNTNLMELGAGLLRNFIK